MQTHASFLRPCSAQHSSTAWSWRFSTQQQNNANPGLITHWLINWGVSPFSGDSSLLEGTPPEKWDGFINPVPKKPLGKEIALSASSRDGGGGFKKEEQRFKEGKRPVLWLRLNIASWLFLKRAPFAWGTSLNFWPACHWSYVHTFFAVQSWHLYLSVTHIIIRHVRAFAFATNGRIPKQKYFWRRRQIPSC